VGLKAGLNTLASAGIEAQFVGRPARMPVMYRLGVHYAARKPYAALLLLQRGPRPNSNIRNVKCKDTIFDE
jgi:hypothetical protein